MPSINLMKLLDDLKSDSTDKVLYELKESGKNGHKKRLENLFFMTPLKLQSEVDQKFAKKLQKILTSCSEEEKASMFKNMETYYGNTILHQLVEDGLFASTQVLLSHGANPNILNKNKESPFTLSITRLKKNFFASLEKAGGKVEQTVFENGVSILENMFREESYKIKKDPDFFNSMIDYLVANGADINYSNNQHWPMPSQPLLLIAYQMADKPVAETLLKHSADPMATYDNPFVGKTTIMTTIKICLEEKYVDSEDDDNDDEETRTETLEIQTQIYQLMEKHVALKAQNPDIKPNPKTFFKNTLAEIENPPSERKGEAYHPSSPK